MDIFKLPVGRLWNYFVDHYLHIVNDDELRVLVYLLRRTIGFQKLEDSVSLSQFLAGSVTAEGRQLNHGTGLSKKRLLRTLHKLEEEGHLVIERGKTARGGNQTNRYQLTFVQAVIQRWSSDLGNGAPTLVPHDAPRVGAPCGTIQGVLIQGLQKKFDHQGSVASTKPPVAVCCPPATPDDDASKNQFHGGKKRQRPSLTDEQLQLLERMQANGVSSSQAHRVLQQARPERIRQSLEYLPYRNAKNPAGYFVREVLSEDFAAPKVLRLDKQREDVKQRRKQEELDQAEAKRAEEEAYRAQRQAAYEALQPDQLRELVEEARRRAVWARNRPEMLAEDSPVLQGLVLDLVDEGWLEKRLGRRESKLNLPPPRGWAESRRGRNQAREARA